MTTTTTTPAATLNRRVLPMLADVASARSERIARIQDTARMFRRTAIRSLRMADYQIDPESQASNAIRSQARRSIVRLNATLAKLDALSL